MNIIYDIAFAQLSHIKQQDKHLMLEKLGSAEEIYKQRNHLRDILPDTSKNIEKEVGVMEDWLRRAEEEALFIEKGGIKALRCYDKEYPQRLRQCSDAPTLLYYRGNIDLNAAHVVSVVGTRQITPYGKGLCESFVKDLSTLRPDVIVVSGLAYGVDIHCHRFALTNRLATVGVLAHGLEQIYPRMHRDTAAEMVKQGGLLTEYLSQTPMDKRHFVQRNRIVAGMADAVVVVESAQKGGSLITADFANGYSRDVFAFPGRIHDTYSAGCNKLIRENRAALIESAEDFMQLVGWESDAEHQRQLSEGIQTELFPSLSSDEQKVMDTLLPSDGTDINTLSLRTNLPINQLSSLLFGLEMKGLIRKMGGNKYRRA